MTFPNSGGAMPPLPPKSLFCELQPPIRVFCFALTVAKDKFRPSFLEKRRVGLAYFLKFVPRSRHYVGILTDWSAAVSCSIQIYRARP